MYREADGDMAKITGWGANVKNAEGKDAYRSAGALTAKGKELVGESCSTLQGTEHVAKR